MSYPQANQAYTEAAVLSASPAQRVVMLYDGAIRFLSQAQMAMERGQMADARARMYRAENIINHLNSSLDMDYDLSHDLRRLYLFCKRHLWSAMVERDAVKMAQVAGLLTDLRGAWAEVASQTVVV